MKFNVCYGIFGVVAGVLLTLVSTIEIRKQHTYRLLRENHVMIDSWKGGINSFLERPNSRWFASPVYVSVLDPSGDADAISNCFKRLPTIANVSYNCRGKKIDVSELKPLLFLPDLDGLDIYECQLDPRAWNLVAGLSKLKWINTQSSGITDEQLKILQASKSLTHLHFHSETLTMEGIKTLVPLKLNGLHLSFMPHLTKKHQAEIQDLFPYTKVVIED